MRDPALYRFRQVIAVALRHLESRREEINDLNVFPVADGDTGDNMARTMDAVRQALDRLERDEGEDASRARIVQVVAEAALLGARGNSGVITSQIVRGAAEILAVVLEAGEEAVRRTPEQLQVLADAKTVDAGAYALVVLVRGMVAGLVGNDEGLPPLPHYPAARIDAVGHADSRFTYCLNLI